MSNKYKTETAHEGKIVKITTKSRFGSHSNMVIPEDDIKDLIMKENLETLGIKYCDKLSAWGQKNSKDYKNKKPLILKDDAGYYISEQGRLDTGLMDPNRAYGR